MLHQSWAAFTPIICLLKLCIACPYSVLSCTAMSSLSPLIQNKWPQCCLCNIGGLQSFSCRISAEPISAEPQQRTKLSKGRNHSIYTSVCYPCMQALANECIFLPAIYFQQQAPSCRSAESILGRVAVQDEGRQMHVLVRHLLTASSILQVY